MKKLLTVMTVFALILSLDACNCTGTAASNTDVKEPSMVPGVEEQLAEEPSAPDEKPELPSDVMNSESPPASPDGEPPTKPDGEPPEKPNGEPSAGEEYAQSSSEAICAGATEITSETAEREKQYVSENADESALLIDTVDEVAITNFEVAKSGDSNGGDNCNFYGQNASVLVKGGSFTNLSNGTIISDASGANGVFCYGGNGGNNGAEGDGTTVIVRDVSITTKGNSSGGIMTTGGGYIEANNLTIDTYGTSSAAIRTDRGGGTVVVNGGTYTSNGLGSPAIYSTADIAVYDAELGSNLSEGVCIEGLNSIALYNCNLTANNTQRNGHASFLDTVMMYQSMSGDAANGTSVFTMSGGTLNSKNGHIFHVTNTNAIINLFGTNIVNEDAANVLLSVCDDGWSGGGNTATLNADGQKLTGTILVGSNSNMTLNLERGSDFEGYFSGWIENASGEVVSEDVGEITVKIDADSTWLLTGDSYISKYEGLISSVDTNGYTLYVNGEPFMQ